MASDGDAAATERMNGMPDGEEGEQGEVYTNGANDSGIEDDKTTGLRTGNQVKAIPKASPSPKQGVTSPRTRIVKGVNRRYRKTTSNLSKMPSPSVSPQHSPKKSSVAPKSSEEESVGSICAGDSEERSEHGSSKMSASSPDVASIEDASSLINHENLVESLTDDSVRPEFGRDDKTTELGKDDIASSKESATDLACIQRPQTPRKGVVKGVNRIPKKTVHTQRPKSEVISRPKCGSKPRPRSDLILDNGHVNRNVHSTPPKAPGSPSPRGKDVRSKVGSMDKIKHKPGGGDVKIVTQKVDIGNVGAKCGSTANIKHTPGGGDKKIESHKLEWEAKSKVGSLNNAKYQPGGGDKKIESKKLEWKVESKIGSLDNARHKAGGGEKKIETQKVEWNTQSKVGSMKYIHHTPKGGEKKIESHKLDFRGKAAPKVGSTKNISHKPGGGDKVIESHKLDFKDRAQARTNHGVNSPGRSPRQVSESSSVDGVDAD